MPTNADLGRAIRHMRWARNGTIESLAITAGMHPTYLSGIERGVRNPTWSKLCALAIALDVSVEQIARDAQAEAYIAARVREARRELEARADRGAEAAQTRP
jgi:transcriptional regulator with XRE-family HTH domain